MGSRDQAYQEIRPIQRSGLSRNNPFPEIRPIKREVYPEIGIQRSGLSRDQAYPEIRPIKRPGLCLAQGEIGSVQEASIFIYKDPCSESNYMFTGKTYPTSRYI